MTKTVDRRLGRAIVQGTLIPVDWRLGRASRPIHPTARVARSNRPIHSTGTGSTACTHRDKIWTHRDGSTTNYKSWLEDHSSDPTDRVLSVRCASCEATLSLGRSRERPVKEDVAIARFIASHTVLSVAAHVHASNMIPEIVLEGVPAWLNPAFPLDAYDDDGVVQVGVFWEAENGWPWDPTRPIAGQHGELARAR